MDDLEYLEGLERLVDALWALYHYPAYRITKSGIPMADLPAGSEIVLARAIHDVMDRDEHFYPPLISPERAQAILHPHIRTSDLAVQWSKAIRGKVRDWAFERRHAGSNR